MILDTDPGYCSIQSTYMYSFARAHEGKREKSEVLAQAIQGYGSKYASKTHTTALIANRQRYNTRMETGRMQENERLSIEYVRYTGCILTVRDKTAYTRYENSHNLKTWISNSSP